LALPVAATEVLPVSVVKAPVLAAVPPIAGGLAKYDEKPAPLTVELADRVVKAPVLGVVAPTDVLLIEPPEIVALDVERLERVASPVVVRVVNVALLGVVLPIIGGAA
jgi:hypothetical protein